jgi:nicotinate phosphoribosyltransferase
MTDNKTILNNNNTEPDSIALWTDKYFTKSKETLSDNPLVTYSVFVRRPILMAPALATSWLSKATKGNVNIQLNYQEGDLVGAGDALMYITGHVQDLIETETHFLQKIGAVGVAAMNARDMCLELPDTPFLAMDARHCAGMEMAEMMAYAASVGSQVAQKQGAKGFIGNATDATAHFFGNTAGLGTMPHAFIGAYDSTLDAAIAYRKTHQDSPLTVLVDFYGQEITDSLALCHHFKDLAQSGELSVRIDTHGGRYLEGLDPQKSYEVLERHMPKAFRGYRSEEQLKHLTGTGVSAAAIWHLREQLDKAGFNKVKIVASSGFGYDKCKAMKLATAPMDMIGTGSYLPQKWTETYATADIICYDGVFKIKSGREFLIKEFQERYGDEQPKI